MKIVVGSLQWRARCAGFAVLEALIAFVILAVGLLTLLNFFAASLQTTADAKTRAVATALAETRLQEIQGYLDVADERVSSAGNGCDEPAALWSLYGDFIRCWWIDDARVVLDPEDPNYSCVDGSEGGSSACWIAVTVDVSWTDRQAQSQQIEVMSIINVRAPEGGARDFMTLATLQHGEVPQWSNAPVGSGSGEQPEALIEDWSNPYPHPDEADDSYIKSPGGAPPGGAPCLPEPASIADLLPGLISDDC